MARACPNCDSEDLRWAVAIQNASPVLDGRLMMHDIRIIGYLGCEECSETVQTVNQDELEAMLNE
jgi:formate-dependent nitrite reductase cytochrome c552 subunit